MGIVSIGRILVRIYIILRREALRGSIDPYRGKRSREYYKARSIYYIQIITIIIAESIVKSIAKYILYIIYELYPFIIIIYELLLLLKRRVR